LPSTNIAELIYDPSDEATRRNPYALFRQLRERDPVHWSDAMEGWIVTDYQLCSDMLSMNEYYSAERITGIKAHLPPEVRSYAEEVLRWLTTWMVFMDQPDHTRIRRHMARVLNANVFATLNDNIVDICTMLLDKLPKNETIDFVREFSIQLPGLVVLDFFGVPRERLFEVKGWSDDMMLFIGSARGVKDKYKLARNGAVSMGTLFQDMIKARRIDPQDDVLTKLMSVDINGDKLTDDEIVGSMMMVLNGGHETTANLINNSIMALVGHPEQLNMLRREEVAMSAAVEELLRYDAPIFSIGRVVKENVVLGGRELIKGERIFAMLAAANRDPKIFSNPDELILNRNPNPHLTFGKGAHHCMGMPLARNEGKIVVPMIVERFKNITIMEDLNNIPWINSMVTRGPTRLPVKLS